MAEDGAPPRVVIVVGVDGSDSAIHAGAYAVGMARRMHATLVAVYVHTLGVYAAAAPSAIPLLQASQAGIVADLRRQIAESGIVDDLDFDFEMVERHGNPYKEIVAVANERRADAVVVGASSQAGHRLVGSLAVHLVRDAKWPVTVVP